MKAVNILRHEVSKDQGQEIDKHATTQEYGLEYTQTSILDYT